MKKIFYIIFLMGFLPLGRLGTTIGLHLHQDNSSSSLLILGFVYPLFLGLYLGIPRITLIMLSQGKLKVSFDKSIVIFCSIYIIEVFIALSITFLAYIPPFWVLLLGVIFPSLIVITGLLTGLFLTKLFSNRCEEI